MFGKETYSFHVPAIKTGFLGVKLIINIYLQELGELNVRVVFTTGMLISP